MLCMNLILRCQMMMIMNEIVWMNAQTISVVHVIFNAYPQLILSMKGDISIVFEYLL